MPYLVKGQNRYDLNATDKADLDIIAEEYDDTAIYSDGDYFTFNGDFYKVDTVNGNYQTYGDNLITSAAFDTENGYVANSAYNKTSAFKDESGKFISGYIALTPGQKYRIENHGITSGTYYPNYSAPAYAAIGQSPNNHIDYNTNTAVDFTAPSGSNYIRLDGLMVNQETISLKAVMSIKTIKVQIAGELSKKLDTSTAASTYLVNDMDTFPIAGSLKPVTSNGIKTALDAKANFVDTQEIISRYAIGNQYSSSVTYNDGDYLAVQRDLYRVDSTGGIIPFGDSIFNKENTSTANGYKNGYCLYYNGSEEESSNERITEYMPILPNTTYVIKWSVGQWFMWNNRYWCFYDSNKQYVTGRSMCNNIFPSSSLVGPQTVIFTTPNNPNIAYMRAVVHNDVWNYLSIQPGSANNLKGVKIVAMDETKRLLATKADVSSIPDVSTKADLSLIAQTYDATSGTYEVGDLVVYNSGLYKCTTDISSPEAWDSTHWTTTTLAEVLKQIQTSLS